MPVQQVTPYEHFPSGDYRPLVQLRLSPEALAERYRLTFADEQDDLDTFKLAAIALPNGEQAWLTRYRGEVEPGTVVLVDAGAKFAQTKALLLVALGLTDADLSWVTPLLDDQDPSSETPEASSAGQRPADGAADP